MRDKLLKDTLNGSSPCPRASFHCRTVQKTSATAVSRRWSKPGEVIETPKLKVNERGNDQGSSQSSLIFLHLSMAEVLGTYFGGLHIIVEPALEPKIRKRVKDPMVHHT